MVPAVAGIKRDHRRSKATAMANHVLGDFGKHTIESFFKPVKHFVHI